MQLIASIIGTAIFVWLCVRWLDKRMFPQTAPPKYTEEQLNEFRTAVIYAQNEIDRIIQSDDVIWRIKPINPNDYGYPPTPDERVYAVRDVELVTEKSDGWCVPQTTGKLIVTDQALVFMSNRLNTRVPWNQIMWIELLLNGYKVHQRIGLPSTYVFEHPNVNFAIVLCMMHLVKTGRGTLGPVVVNSFTQSSYVRSKAEH